MKARHVLAATSAAVVVAWLLASCSQNPVVSIDQRISTFQADLNTSTQSNAYENFHPDQTSDYNALKDGSKTVGSVLPPPTGTPYILTITDKGSPSTGVTVTVTGGPSPGTQYLLLVMATYNMTDWRIVSLAINNSGPPFPAPIFH